VDNGQRFKLCANTEAELQRWVDALSPFCAHAKANATARLASPVRKGGPSSSTGSLGDESDFADTSGGDGGVGSSSDISRAKSLTQAPSAAAAAAAAGSSSPGAPVRRRSASEASVGSPLSSGSSRKSAGSSSPGSGSAGTRGRPLGAADTQLPPPLVEAAGEPAEPTMKKKQGRWSTTAPAAASGSVIKPKLEHPAEAGGFLGSGGLLECALLLIAMNLCFAAVALGGVRSYNNDNNGYANSDGTEDNDANNNSSSTHHDDAWSSESSLSGHGTGGSSLVAVAWSAWWPAAVANFAAVAALAKLQARHAAAARAAQAQHEALARARASAKVKARQKQAGAGAGAGVAGKGNEAGAGAAAADSSGASCSGGGEGGLIQPGKTIKRIDAGRPVGPEDMPSFTPGDLNSFELRTVGYKKHGRKAPSSSPLYELVALDVFKTGNKVRYRRGRVSSLVFCVCLCLRVRRCVVSCRLKLVETSLLTASARLSPIPK